MGWLHCFFDLFFFVVTKLEGMHRKHLLPGFNDRSSDEAAINNLTSEITDVRRVQLNPTLR